MSSSETKANVTAIRRQKSLKNVTANHDFITKALSDHGVKLNEELDSMLVAAVEIAKLAKVETINIDIAATGSIEFNIPLPETVVDDMQEIDKILIKASMQEMSNLLKAVGDASMLQMTHNLPGSEDALAGAIGSPEWLAKQNFAQTLDETLKPDETKTEQTVNEPGPTPTPETESSATEQVAEEKKPTVAFQVVVPEGTKVKDMVLAGSGMLATAGALIGVGVFAIVKAIKD